MKTIFFSGPRWIWVLVFAVAFGFARAPLENRLTERLQGAHLLPALPEQQVMDQMRQSVLLGTLGGLRSLISTFLGLKVYNHFADREWEELLETYEIILALEPREEAHWDMASWHLGYNATADMSKNPFLNEFEAEQRRIEFAWQGIRLAERGIEALPESVKIRRRLAGIYESRLKDNCAAADIWGEIAIRRPALFAPFSCLFSGAMSGERTGSL